MKYKTFSLLFTVMLSYSVSAEENWEFQENSDEYALWAEMAFKHTLVSAIKTVKKTNTAVGIHHLDENQKKLVALPLSAGALAAVALASNSAYNAINSTSPKTVSQLANTYVGQYAKTVSSLNATAQQRRLQYARHRRSLARVNNFQPQAIEELKKLQSHIKPPSQTRFSLWSKALKGTGVLAVGSISAGAYAGIIGGTAVIAFEDEMEMQMVLEQFSNDVREIAEALEVSEGIEFADSFESEVEGA